MGALVSSKRGGRRSTDSRPRPSQRLKQRRRACRPPAKRRTCAPRARASSQRSSSFTQPMNAAGQRVDYDRRATQTYGSTICQMTQVAQQWWSAGDRTKAHNLAYNARQFAPYLENAAVDGRQYAEQAAQWAQQAQAANARLGQIVSALNQLASGAGSGAGDADMQRARVLADAGVRRQADALGLVNQANGRRTAGGDPDGLLANADQWLARVAPAQAALGNAVQQINPKGNVVVGNWTLVRSSDAAVQNSVRGCSGLAASPINDLLASAATIDAEYRALLSAYSGAQQCRTAAGAIEAAATGGTGGGAVTGGTQAVRPAPASVLRDPARAVLLLVPGVARRAGAGGPVL